ncbi:hypothetical protein GEMRC1_000521 [Eukaryota sp. GEM-RC1]
MAFRSLKHSPCLCGRSKASNFHHLVKCHQFIHLRSIIHKSIRGTGSDMFKANGFTPGKIAPLPDNLCDQPKVHRSRGDLIRQIRFFCQEIIMDFTTVDPYNSRSISNLFDDDLSALEVAEKVKNTKYCHLNNQLNVDRYNSFVFQVVTTVVDNLFSRSISDHQFRMQRVPICSHQLVFSKE